MNNWFDLENITWSCHICKEIRPDEKISVRKTDLSKEADMPEGSIIENVRYCNDKPECIEKSKGYRHFKGCKLNKFDYILKS